MTKSKQKLISLVGWYGVTVILLAYILLSFKALDSQSLLYQLLNLTGAAAIVGEALSKKDTPPVVLNVIWAAVAFVPIIRILIS